MEVFAESRLVGEMECIGYFCYSGIRHAKLCFSFKNYMFLNPFACRFMGVLRNYIGNIFG